MNCAVVGAGAWGTALADLLGRNGHNVRLWAYEPDVVEAINKKRENVRFLPGAALNKNVEASNNFEHILDGADVIIFVTPSQLLRKVASECRRYIKAGIPLVIASKGIEATTLALMSEVIEEIIPGNPIVAVSGPSFAAEVVAQQPTAVVAASKDKAAAATVQKALSNMHFRTYTHDDVIGVELGGSLKNVIAVATGIAEGLGLGFNARAALITRGLAEISRMGSAIGAQPLTFAGLAGMGDLVLTCTGSLSRNRAIGMEIGRGGKLQDLLAARDTVAEGVATTESACALAKKMGIDMPIVHAVHSVLFEGRSARDAISHLMGRELRNEQD